MELLNRNLFNAHCSSSEQIFQSDNALTFKSVIHFTIPTFIGVAFSTFHLVTMGLDGTEPNRTAISLIKLYFPTRSQCALSQ